MNPTAIRGLYHHLVDLYPSNFRAEYGDEIQLVFELSLESKAGWAAWRLFLRELVSVPRVLLSLYWRECQRQGLQSVFLASVLPEQDGRHSWVWASIETLFFLGWTLLLAIFTYVDYGWLRPGWYRDLSLLGIPAGALPLPILLLGLGRALPRWVYPFYGLLLTYLCYAGLRFHLELILVAFLLALFSLVIIAARVNARRPLPDFVQYLGNSLRLDPLRWSFAIYGAAPLLLLWAYDDGYANDRTLYLFVSTIGMLLGALIYIRSKSSSGRLSALAAGLALATWPAILDRATHTGFIYSGEAVPILGLWALVTALILVPSLMPGASILFIRKLKKG